MFGLFYLAEDAHYDDGDDDDRDRDGDDDDALESLPFLANSSPLASFRALMLITMAAKDILFI